MNRQQRIRRSWPLWLGAPMVGAGLMFAAFYLRDEHLVSRGVMKLMLIVGVLCYLVGGITMFHAVRDGQEDTPE